MIVCFSEIGWEDYLYRQKQDKKAAKRINDLIRDIIRIPSDKAGIGKPGMLKGDLSGYFLRRITKEQRLVYKIIGDKLIIAQCRFHY